ncbi:hypothetical protein X927_05700 [Petrotoga mexicana DSM 14811]|uniref:Uncharacterized protein n=1 Tax=Petrotoga mexicana DSM 14811 TaxID=1122954 RepID=A0A2K1P9M8_9BACT|nr:hypothetical protein X927_05700 [Petrotoga mexicana DSM 14811]
MFCLFCVLNEWGCSERNKNSFILMGGLRLLQYANYVLNDFDLEFRVFKGLAPLQPCAKSFFKIKFDFELRDLKGFTP